MNRQELTAALQKYGIRVVGNKVKVSDIKKALAASTKYRYFQDPGHGWLEVPLQEIADLGLANSISHYSYRKGKMGYLEEDSDMPKFFKAYEDEYGKKPEYEEIEVGDIDKNNPRNFRRW